MRHVTVQYMRAALDRIRWGDDGSIEEIVHFPSGNTFLRDIEELTNVSRCIPMRDEPEGTLLQIFAAVAVDHERCGVYPMLPDLFFRKLPPYKLFHIHSHSNLF